MQHPHYYPRAIYPQMPRYVPPNYPRRPPEKSGLGCIAWTLIVLLGGGILVGGGILIIVAFVIVGVRASGDDDDESTTEQTTTTNTENAGTTEHTGNTTNTTNATGGSKITTKGKIGEIESAFSVGRCDGPDNERTRKLYNVKRMHGSAHALRGKIAAVHLRLGMPSMSWNASSEERVDHGALATARFLKDEATRHGVTDLEIDVVPWTLKSTYELPTLRVQPDQMLPPDQMDEIERDAGLAVETALGEPLETMVSDLKSKGYDEVAFAVYFPTTVTVRDWASPAWWRTTNRAEVCYIFSPTKARFASFAVVVSHETLHLFGADDLYRIVDIDSDDKGDPMDVSCSGYGGAHIGDATSYAIGWRTTPPPRKYGFKEW